MTASTRIPTARTAFKQIPTTQVAAEYIKLVTAENPEVKRQPGLILSREDVINIKLYVKYGLMLPTTYNEVVSYLGYTRSDIAGLEPSEIQKLFTAIHENAKKWTGSDGIETRVKQQGLDLQNFANEFTTMGDEIIAYIESMSIVQRALRTVGTTNLPQSAVNIPFTTEDHQVVSALSELIKLIKKNIADEEESTRNLRNAIAAFRNEISAELEPQVKQKWRLITNANVSQQVTDLKQDIEELEEEIAQLKKDYDKYVGLAFTGAAGGIVGIAITGGVFGDKAEKTRKKRNEKIQVKRQKEAELANREKVATAMSALNNQFEDLHIRLVDAETGAANLEFVWQSLHTTIDNSLDDISQIQDGDTLVKFLAQFKGIVEPWKQVKNSANELMQIFNDAMIEYRKLSHS